MEISVKITNIEEVRKFLETRPQRTREELNRAIEKSVFQVERQAKINSPVKTGRLKTSIQARQYELKGEVGVGVRYGIFVHEPGITRRWSGNPFLANAVRTMKSSIEKYFKEAIENVISK